MAGISFEILADLNMQGDIRLKKITAYSALSLLFRRPLPNYDGPFALSRAMAYYNIKLSKYCIAESLLICVPMHAV